MRDAMELAALEGRGAVFDEAASGRAFAGAEEDLPAGAFREQIDFLRQKQPTVSRVWTDFMRGQHDRALVVAGVTDQAMIEDFAEAIIRAGTGHDFRAFAADFDRIVEQYGWSYNGGREWRIRTIFDTNLRTSHMAGRLKQMRDPEMVRRRPYWMYVHGETRIPLEPRPLHLSWDGLVLNWDDPWWDVYFPPNDWKCSCGVRTLSRSDLRAMGRTGPDAAPEIVRRPYLHKASGQAVMQPEGAGFGWDYMPGRAWADGLVPSSLLRDPAVDEMQGPRLRSHLVLRDEASPMADLLERSRPFDGAPMDPGLPAQAYLAALLAPLGGAEDRAALWTDVTGHRLVISGDMWLDGAGRWKGGKRGHAVYAPFIAQTLIAPDEIWLNLREVPSSVPGGRPELVLTRRYIRVDRANGIFVLFEMGRTHWQEVTGYAALNRSNPGFSHIDRLRVGKLIWQRG